MKTLWIALLALIASVAQAQTTSQVRMVMGVGYANGTVEVMAIAPNGGAVNHTSYFLDPNGNLTITNLVQGSVSVIRVCNSTGASCLQTNVQPTGVLQDITAALNASPLGGSGNPNSVTSIAAQLNAASSGIIGMYLIPATDTAASLTDFSTGGVGNATGTVGTAPTVIAVTGGLNCTQNGAVILPAALNSNGANPALAMMAWGAVSSDFSTSATDMAFIAGNGNGATGGNIDMMLSNRYGGITAAMGGGMGIRAAGNNAYTSLASSSFNGAGSLALVPAATDVLYVNGKFVTDCQNGIGSPNGACGNTAAKQTTGAYQICGTAAGSGMTNTTYMFGKVYAVIFWNRVPAASEVLAVHNILTSYVASKGVSTVFGNTDNGTVNAINLLDEGLFLGDSITEGFGAIFPWPRMITFSGAFNTPDVTGNAYPNQSAENIRGSVPLNTCPYFKPFAGKNFVHIWAGTNDLELDAKSAVQTYNNLASISAQARLCGFKTIVATMLSRGVNDSTRKDVLNPLIRQNWTTAFDGLNDVAMDALIGADNADVGTGFQGDHIHPTSGSYWNNISFMGQRGINAFYGNTTWATANTYGVTATAPNTITAASESGNTVTLTFAANVFPVGSCITVAGVTPAGYNSPTTAGALQCWHVNGSTGTTVTFFTDTTGLGAGTVFGTAVTAQELDVDAYARLTQCTTCTHTLQTCLGRQTIFRRIESTSAWTITPQNSGETINGGATFTAPVSAATNNPVVRLDVIPVSLSSATGGCTWKASLQ